MQIREILAVHTHQETLDTVEQYLNAEFEDVILSKATSALEAEELLRSRPFALVLASSRLPDKLGVQVYVAAKQTRYNGTTPFVMLVDEDSTESSSMFFQHGIEHVLHLPFSSDQLLQKVHALSQKVEKRRVPRISYPGVSIRLTNISEPVIGTVVNLGDDSILAEFQAGERFRAIFESPHLTLNFPVAIDSIKVENIPIKLNRMIVVQWDELNNPAIIRVAWSFTGIEAQQAALLHHAFDLISKDKGV